MRPEDRPPRILHPGTAPQQHLSHGRGEVVIADLPGRDAAQLRECVHMPFQKRLLPAGREHLVHGLAGIRHAVDEQKALGHHPGQPHPQLTEIDLGLQPWRVMLRHEHLRGAASLLHPDLRPAPRHVIAHRRVRHPCRAVLIQQPRVDPLHRVPLLTGRIQIRPQPLIDHRLERIEPRGSPLRRLARSRLGTSQCLTHQAPVHPVLAGQRPDRHALTPRIAPDPLEQLGLRGRHGGLLDAGQHQEPPTATPAAGPLQADTRIQ